MKTLIIVAREPVPGMTKTRLCPPLDGGTAAALYECFLRDVLAIVRQVSGVRRVVAYTAESSPDYFAHLAPDFATHSQCGAHLGERLEHALRTALDGARAVQGAHHEAPAAVVMNSDSPDLPAAYVSAAFDRLAEGADVVLGPTADGGYYLIGVRTPQPRLLHEVPMSTPTVLRDTVALAHALDLRVALLPGWYDIDTVDDLRHLQGALAQAGPEVAPATRMFLRELDIGG